MASKLRYAIQHCTEMDADFKLTDTDVAGWGNVMTSTSATVGVGGSTDAAGMVAVS